MELTTLHIAIVYTITEKLSHSNLPKTVLSCFTNEETRAFGLDASTRNTLICSLLTYIVVRLTGYEICKEEKKYVTKCHHFRGSRTWENMRLTKVSGNS